MKLDTTILIDHDASEVVSALCACTVESLKGKRDTHKKMIITMAMIIGECYG